jgi:hypothetical protein
MMMIANLVGFAVGLDGVKEMLIKIFATAHGLSFYLLRYKSCLKLERQRKERVIPNGKCK